MPSTASEPRDRFVLERRGDRPLHDPWRHQGVIIDEEADGAGGVVRAATVFLTGRECPWRCVMCDLWRQTTADDTRPGAIPHQIADALASRHVVDSPRPTHLKLYNAGSFFDVRAVPPGDDEAIAALVSRFARVIVESHPALVGDRTWRLQERLARDGAELEVAMGLETAHPEALARLNKRMTVEQFAAGARRLAAHGARLRVFLLVSPPFIDPLSQERWLARSVATAFECGASVVSLIPTRSGNGAMEAIQADGDFRVPTLRDLEQSMDVGLGVAVSLGGGDRVVLADTWDLARFSTCDACLDVRRARLVDMNVTQRSPDPIACDECGAVSGEIPGEIDG
jgi:archaeosine synthase beta-subunit